MTREEADRLLELAREARLTGPETATWVERLSPERDALREAAEWLVAGGEAEAATELAAAVWRLWLLRGEPADGRRLLAPVLDRDARATSARARALYADGALAFRTGDQAASRARNEAALAVARELGDLEAEALALVGLSRVAFRAGDYARVRELAGQARALVRALDRQADVAPLHLLAAGTRLAGDYDAAQALYEESLALNRELGDDYMCSVELHNLGHVTLHRGDLGAAERLFADCTELRRGSENPYDDAMESLNRAALAYHRGEADDATSLLSASESTLREAGVALDPDDQFEVDWLRERLADRA